MLARHHELLEQVSARYGVSPSLIVGIWGFESNFGRFSGMRPTIAALATLAWDPRRSALFRAELFDALEILNRGDIELARLKGSWAGAMGQVQFMPSSYLKFAEDFDGDGRRDIWATPSDIFASIANYLKGHGWVDGDSVGPRGRRLAGGAQRIANEVDSRNGTCRATRDMTVALPAATWQALGVRTGRGRLAAGGAARRGAGDRTGARVPREPQLRRPARIQLLARLRHQRGPARRPHRRRRARAAAGQGESRQVVRLAHNKKKKAQV